MKNSICTLLFFSITSFTLFSQSIIQVNNNNDANADYTTLQAAIDAATAGAIIYLHPSGTSYGDATIAKRLSIIGPGYNIGMNAAGDTNVNLGNAIVGAINFNTGSNNSSITGCSIGNIIIAEVANILIQRNEFRTRSSEQIVVTNSTNIIINANYFEDVTYTHIVAFSDGVVISNNIIFSDDSRPIHGSGLIIRNNIFFGYCTVDNSVVENNISFGYYPIRGSNNQIQNNVFTDDRAYPDNQTNISSSSIFVGYPTRGGYSFDGRFQLKTDSPAKSYGNDGKDAGVFGGSEPYRLSGLSTLPYIYEIQAPNSASQGGGLNVTIKARSGN